MINENRMQPGKPLISLNLTYPKLNPVLLLGTLQKPWAYCLKKAELTNVPIHYLRHISASDLYHAGNPERMIMDIAGWKTPMLSTYRHKDSFKSAQSIQFSKPIQTASEEKTITFAVNSR